MQLDLEQWGKGAQSAITAIELIAQSLKGKKGTTGNEDCDSCNDLLLADALDIFKAIHAKFELIPNDHQDKRTQ